MCRLICMNWAVGGWSGLGVGGSRVCDDRLLKSLLVVAERRLVGHCPALGGLLRHFIQQILFQLNNALSLPHSHAFQKFRLVTLGVGGASIPLVRMGLLFKGDKGRIAGELGPGERGLGVEGV